MPAEPARLKTDDVVLRVQALLGGGRVGMAEQELMRHLGTAPDDGWALATLAYCQMQRGDYRAADETAAAAIAAEPDLGWAHFVLGLTVAADAEYGDEKRYEDDGRAMRAVHRAKDAFAWDFNRDDKRVGRAVGHVEQAIALDPEHAGYRHTLAELYVALDRPRDAVRTLREALAIDPSHAESAATLTHLLRTHGLADRAEIAARQALAENPNAENLHEQRGWLCLRRGEAEEAAGHFEAALRARPGAVGPRHGLQSALLATRPGLGAVVRAGEKVRALAVQPGRVVVWVAVAAAVGTLAGGLLGLGDWLPATRQRASALDGWVLGGALGAVAGLLALVLPRAVQLIALLALRRDPRAARLLGPLQWLGAWVLVLGLCWALAVAATAWRDLGGVANQWALVGAAAVMPLACALTADRGRGLAAWAVAGATVTGIVGAGQRCLPGGGAWVLVFVAIGFAGALAALVASRRAV